MKSFNLRSMMPHPTRLLTLAALAALLVNTAACAPSTAQPSASTAKVGPPAGSVIVVGGGSVGPEVQSKFIELAGGPDALINDVPTAGGDSAVPQSMTG